MIWVIKFVVAMATPWLFILSIPKCYITLLEELWGGRICHTVIISISTQIEDATSKRRSGHLRIYYLLIETCEKQQSGSLETRFDTSLAYRFKALHRRFKLDDRCRGRYSLSGQISPETPPGTPSRCPASGQISPSIFSCSHFPFFCVPGCLPLTEQMANNCEWSTVWLSVRAAASHSVRSDRAAFDSHSPVWPQGGHF